MDPNKQPTGPAGMTTPKNVVQKNDRDMASAKNTDAPPPLAPDNAPKGVVAELHPVGWLGRVPIDQIEVGPIALRPAQVESDQFQFMKKSVEQEGINQNLTVWHDPEMPGKYRLIDGLQRFTIASMIGLDEVPILVKDADDAKAQSLQIQGNLHRVDTKPAQFGAAIIRLIGLNPEKTILDLAAELSVSPTYIQDRINVAKHLVPEIAKRVDEGELTASAAIQLAKLPSEEQVSYVGRAAALPITEFTELVSARKKELKEALNKGDQPEPTFTPIPRLRSKADLVAEYEKHAARATFVTEGMTAPQAFDAAIAWAIQLDDASVDLEREKWENEQKAKAERKAAREQAQKDKAAAAAPKQEDAAAAALAEA